MGACQRASRLIQAMCDQSERSDNLITTDATFPGPQLKSKESQGIPRNPKEFLEPENSCLTVPCTGVPTSPAQFPKQRIPQATSSTEVNVQSSQNSCRDGTDILAFYLLPIRLINIS